MNPGQAKTARPTLNQIYAPIQADLEAFRSALAHELESKDELIGNIHRHLLKMTGKFLRPALALLTSKIGQRSNDDVVRLAVAIELIHTATLVHDDIIDDSALRRNQPTVYNKWGREISIVAGDYLYAKAFLLLAGLKDLWINRAFAACAHVMCEGEMKQIEKRSNYLMDEEEYLKIIHQKTAALFQAACVGGAYFAGAPKDVIEKLGQYGYGLGMAFQIMDDCLDLIGDAENVGKTMGLDVAKSDVSLPMLYLFQALSERDRQQLLSEVRNGAKSNELFEKIKMTAVGTGSVEKAMAKARRFVDESLECLNVLDAGVHKDSLAQLAAHCVERVR